MNKKKYLRSFLPIALMACAFSQPSVAVLDFAANGLPAYEVETLVERLRSELPNTGAVRLVDRKMLENILQEQGLQQSGCTTAECSAEIGELLGAEFMISGSIGKLGDSFTVDMKMVSVTTGAAERAKSLTFDGNTGGLLVEMQILAWEIVALKPPQALILKRTGAEGGEKITVAIMDFDPRGISQLEAQTLTDRFATEVDATGRAILVDRRQMMEVMEEQGYDEAGCTSEECAAEVGALLGVGFMINGAIGKLGDTYTIDAKMFEVATGAAAKTKNATYNGPVDGLITEIEILAWEMMGLKPPRTLTQKRKGTITQEAAPTPKTPLAAAVRSALIPGWGQLYTSNALDNDPLARRKALYFFAGEVGAGAIGYLIYSGMKASDDDTRKYHTQYLAATDAEVIRSLKTKSDDASSSAESSKGQLTILAYVLGAAHIYNIIDAYMNGPNDDMPYNNKKIDLVYNPELNQPQLRFTFALD